MPKTKKTQTVGDLYDRDILRLVFLVVLDQVIDKLMKMRVVDNRLKKPVKTNTK